MPVARSWLRRNGRWNFFQVVTLTVRMNGKTKLINPGVICGNWFAANPAVRYGFACDWWPPYANSSFAQETDARQGTAEGCETD